jgi:hypothetical protein
MIVLGIDPGKAGAMVALRYPESRQAEVLAREFKTTLEVEGVWETDRSFILPQKGKREYHDDEIARVISELAPRTQLAVLERTVGAVIFAGKGEARKPIRGGGQQGEGVGLWRMALACYGIRRQFVTPGSWMARVLFGEPGQGKERAVSVASRLVPGLPLPRGKHRAQAIAEAACLALYGIRYGLIAPVTFSEMNDVRGTQTVKEVSR